MSTVAVIVPAYNYGRYLADCISSITKQPDVGIRVLILDDCSTDETPQIGPALAEMDPRVHYLRHERNRGHIATYNEGIEWAADADYISVLSADDLLTPGALRRAAAALDANPDATFVYGGVVGFQSGRPLPRARTAASTGRVQVGSGEAWVASVCRYARAPVISPEVVFRGSVLIKAGGFRADLPHWADMELFMRCAALGEVARIVDADQAFYRMHGTNMHLSRTEPALEKLRSKQDVFTAFFDSDAAARLDIPQLRRLANRALAQDALGRACGAVEQGRTDVDGTPIPDLITYAGGLARIDDLPEYRALRRRMWLGHRRARALRPVLYGLRYPRLWLRWRMRHARPFG